MSRRRCVALCSTVCVALVVLVSPVSLFALDPHKRLTQFVHTAWTPRDGAPSDLAYIAQTPDGYLWLGSPLATFRFDGARFLPWNPPSEWAHPADRGWRGALFVSRDGSLWMGLAEGLARIRNNEFAWHKIASDQNQNSITSIVAEDDEHLWAAGTRLYRRDGSEWRCLPLHAGAERLVVNTLAAQTSIDVKAPAVRLEPLSQPLDISFSGISLGHPEQLRFRYRLDGVDRDWRETQHRTVSYSQIPAGDFRLRVVAIDHRGTPSEREAVWHFSVAPRWYERW